jgi:heme exporter protein B
MNGVVAVFARELRVAARNRAEWLMPPFFFVVVVTLFGLGARPNDPQLATFAPAVLWVAGRISRTARSNRCA